MSDKQWNGEGLPQVGDECEVRIGTQNKWRQAKLKFVGDDILVALVGDKEICWRLEYCSFRPVHISAKEREKAIIEMAEIANRATGFGQNLADHAALYDAGYRKQVAP